MCAACAEWHLTVLSTLVNITEEEQHTRCECQRKTAKSRAASALSKPDPKPGHSIVLCSQHSTEMQDQVYLRLIGIHPVGVYALLLPSKAHGRKSGLRDGSVSQETQDRLEAVIVRSLEGKVPHSRRSRTQKHGVGAIHRK
jgi:hypothetical protein